MNVHRIYEWDDLQNTRVVVFECLSQELDRREYHTVEYHKSSIVREKRFVCGGYFADQCGRRESREAVELARAWVATRR